MALVTKNFSDIITFTRASTGTYFDSSGTLTSAAIDVPRFDYDPATLLARGLLIEEARTNSIRNNTMQGASAGVAPTNWTGWNATTNGVTISSSAAGTENGIAYIDVAVSGTCTLTGTAQTPSFEVANNIAATIGQTWTESVYWKLVSGSIGDASFNIRITEADSGGLSLVSGDSPAITPAVGNLSSARYTFTRTLTNASTAFIIPRLRFGFVNGSTYSFTLRIGLPQLEQGAFATSVIQTFNTNPLGVTRSADVASVNTLSPWFNASESTLYTEFNTSVPTTVSASAVVAGYDDGTANNRFSNFYTSNTGALATNQVIAGTPSFTISAASGLTLSNVQKQATRFKAGSYASSANGAAVVPDSFASAPPTVNTLRFGLRPSGTQANMWLRRVTVYPRGLSNAELQAITA